MTTDCRMDVPVDDLPAWDPRVGWDEAEEERPAPDCGHGLWLTASGWLPEHGDPDANGYVKAPPGARCVCCGVLLAPHSELLAPVACSNEQHYHCGNCAAFLED